MILLRCASYKKLQEESRPRQVRVWILESLEIGIGAICSVITWRFTLQSESAPEPQKVCGRSFPVSEDTGANPRKTQSREQNVAECLFSDVLLNPSPELMLVSCLVFGCCVSSFVHRRQTQDAFQFVIYAVFITAAVVVGYGLEASANLILLGYAPLAMCVGMATSLYGDALFKRQRKLFEKRLRYDEKALLLV